jgi:hypothetical protein
MIEAEPRAEHVGEQVPEVALLIQVIDADIRDNPERVRDVACNAETASVQRDGLACCQPA